MPGALAGPMFMSMCWLQRVHRVDGGVQPNCTSGRHGRPGSCGAGESGHSGSSRAGHAGASRRRQCSSTEQWHSAGIITDARRDQGARMASRTHGGRQEAVPSAQLHRRP